MSRARSRGFLGWGYREPDGKRPDPRRAALLGLLIVVSLVGLGLFLVHVLRASAQLQDCVMQGRSNCAPIAAP